MNEILRKIKALIPILLFMAAGQGNSGELRLTEVIPLAGDTFHVQGIDTDGRKLWVSSVDVKNKHGMLFEYEMPTARPVRSVELQDGVHFHPGGLMADRDSVWIPVAEYRRNSTAVIQRRNKLTLALEAQFEVNDHIGAVAVTPNGIAGANWDAREFYVWDKAGRLIRKLANASGVAFQDMKFIDGQLVGGGLNPDKSGTVVWFAWPSLRETKRLAVGRTDTGLAMTHEGMAIYNYKVWFLPEDNRSRLFVFDLPSGW